MENKRGHNSAKLKIVEWQTRKSIPLHKQQLFYCLMEYFLLLQSVFIWA